MLTMPSMPPRFLRPARSLRTTLLCAAVLLAAGCALPGAPSSRTGSVAAATNTPAPTATPIPVATEFPGAPPGNAYGLQLSGNTLWFAGPDSVSQVSANGRLTGTVRVGGYIRRMIAAYGQVWMDVATSNGDAAAKLTASGVQLIPLPAGTLTMIAGSMLVRPDGSLWYLGQTGYFLDAQSRGGASTFVGHVAPSGNLQQFAVPLRYYVANEQFGLPSFAATADGRLSYVVSYVHCTGQNPGTNVINCSDNSGGSRLGMVASNGSQQLIAPPGAVTYLGGALTGPDGSLWILGTTKTTGTLLHYAASGASPTSVPLPSNRVQSLALLPDGTLWDMTDKTLVHLAADGSVLATFPIPQHFLRGELPPDDGSQNQLVAGRNGTVWFTERPYPYVGEITPDGALLEYDVSDPAFPISVVESLAVGPDGAMWYSDSFYRDPAKAAAAGAIGRIGPQGS